MKKFLFFIVALIVGTNFAEAAVRTATSISRESTSQSNNQNTVARTASSNMTNKTISQRTSTTTSGRASATGEVVNRSAANARTGVRTSTQTASPRSATQTVARTARETTTLQGNIASARSAAIPRQKSTANTARATVSVSTTASNTFGTGYNICRDAYFTCMDQFCANQNDTYRRCVCSSKLTEIQNRERALKEASGQLQDFSNLNLEVINKTASEVKAMLSASEGETKASTTTDTSNSASKLAGISEVLANAKSQSLSTQGTLDIAGDINAIWSTTDLTSGANISNLTGEQLYNAVHAQCVELVASSCQSTSTLNMVVAAYGMYIENDCSLIINNLDKQLTNANSTIRQTEREMNLARLENYNAHNSTSINDCIANVRKDLTADTACGKDYVHCLDISGKYLNRETGEPIYTPEFYQLESQISLSGDVLTNPSNRMLVAELNRMKIYAEKSLNTCQDLSSDVWDEFMRQAITEIYQGQQEKIREVKNECLDVVNTCYDTQTESLKDFSNIKEQLLLGSRLELAEEMCQEKLYACSNLYGDPNGQGLELLVNAMKDITDQKIAKECLTTLQEFAKNMCSVPSTDSLHGYPYACRVYAPGEQKYATNQYCNNLLWSSSNKDENQPSTPETPTKGYVCPDIKTYTGCKPGYYLAVCSSTECAYNGTPTVGNICAPCPGGKTCAGGTEGPKTIGDGGEGEDTVDCGPDYVGSMYQKLVRYAMETCVRPSESDSVIPTNILGDVNTVMDSIKVEMAKELSAECARLGGTWVDGQWIDEEGNKTCTDGSDGEPPMCTVGDGVDGLHDITNHRLYKKFYDETSANTKWGYCADPESVTAYTTTVY